MSWLSCGLGCAKVCLGLSVSAVVLMCTWGVLLVTHSMSFVEVPDERKTEGGVACFIAAAVYLATAGLSAIFIYKFNDCPSAREMSILQRYMKMSEFGREDDDDDGSGPGVGGYGDGGDVPTPPSRLHSHHRYPHSLSHSHSQLSRGPSYTSAHTLSRRSPRSSHAPHTGPYSPTTPRSSVSPTRYDNGSQPPHPLEGGGGESSSSSSSTKPVARVKGQPYRERGEGAEEGEGGGSLTEGKGVSDLLTGGESTAGREGRGRGSSSPDGFVDLL